LNFWFCPKGVSSEKNSLQISDRLKIQTLEKSKPNSTTGRSVWAIRVDRCDFQLGDFQLSSFFTGAVASLATSEGDDFFVQTPREKTVAWRKKNLGGGFLKKITRRHTGLAKHNPWQHPLPVIGLEKIPKNASNP